MADDAKAEAYVTATVALIATGKSEIEEALFLIWGEVKNTHECLAVRLLALRRYLAWGRGKSYRSGRGPPSKPACTRALVMAKSCMSSRRARTRSSHDGIKVIACR
jgi:hypothetical protein